LVRLRDELREDLALELFERLARFFLLVGLNLDMSGEADVIKVLLSL
jgi:hypothetical protein